MLSIFVELMLLSANSWFIYLSTGYFLLSLAAISILLFKNIKYKIYHGKDKFKYKKLIADYKNMSTELKISNEGLWAANEELVAANEELASANELIKHQGEDLLSQSEEKLHALLRTLDDMVWSHSPDFTHFIYMSESCKKLTGYTATEYYNDPSLLMSSVVPEDLPIIQNNFALMAKEGTGHTEIRIKTKDNQLKWVYTKAWMVKDKDGNPIRFDGISTDITKRKQIEKEQSRLTDELIWRNNDLEQFTYITSHNLRSPVTNIMGLIKVIDKDSIENELNLMAINKLEIAANNLDKIIVDLNTVISLRKNINEIKINIDLLEGFKDVMVGIENMIESSNAKIEMDFSEVGQLFTIRSYFYNIILNLLTNAIKYKSLSADPDIKIKSYAEGDYTCISIRDNGLGIDIKNQKEKLFKLYKRFHFHTEGKGMGLYLVKTQIEAIEGRIEVESEVAVGSTFKIYFKNSQNETISTDTL